MAIKVFKRYCVLLVVLLTGFVSFGQSVPLGIFYQAVARDNMGKELINREIDVKLSIISGNPLGPVAYQELWSTSTTKFGVFTLRIGEGQPTGGTYGSLAEVQWGQASHFLKVEVKLDNDFVDMGTMQFMSVPYALYAQKSLEPGPEGPKGDPGPKGEAGDPSSDNQTLSLTTGTGGKFLSISGGNSVELSSIEGDGDPTNEIQDLFYDAPKRELRLLKSTAPPIDLTELKNDADADPVNEIQTLSYDQDNSQLTLNNGGGMVTINRMVAFRAGIASTVNLIHNTAVDLVFEQVSGVYYNEGGSYNSSTGGFVVPYNGIYSFSVSINLPTYSSLIVEVGGVAYETLIGPTGTTGGTFKESITMKLNKGDVVNVAVLQTNGYPIPYNFSGYFSGYRVN